MNRATVAALAVGLLAVAVAVHPRLDDTRRRLWGTAGAGLLAASIITIAAAVVTAGRQVDEIDDWRIAHTENARANRSSTWNTSAAPSTSNRAVV